MAKDKEGIIRNIVNFILMLYMIIKGEFMEDGGREVSRNYTTLMNV